MERGGGEGAGGHGRRARRLARRSPLRGTAELGQTSGMQARHRGFDGLIFDMDGTLTHPTIDFAAMRRDLGSPEGDIAHYVLSLPPAEREQAWEVIEAYEARALENQRLQPGAAALLADCRAAGIKLGVVTRNVARSVEVLCRTYGLTFDAVVTREFPHIKPHPGPILHILAQWGLGANRALMVGDYVHDIECGRAAGTATCFFQNPGHVFHGREADYTVASFDELRAIVL